MNITPKKIVALIPCYNEEASIADVIKKFPYGKIAHHGYTLEVVVIDNNSSDKTAEVARAAGATVIREARQGKGYAMRTGFASIRPDTDYVVMLDGDSTYDPREILRLVQPIEEGFCNVIIGSRLGGRIHEGSMTLFNRAGNWLYSHLIRFFFRVNVTDVLTGYFAWTRQALEELYPHLISPGFAIEIEMVSRMARLGQEIYSVPISYHPRNGVTNLRPIYDGTRILIMFIRCFFWKPTPAFSKVGARQYRSVDDIDLDMTSRMITNETVS